MNAIIFARVSSKDQEDGQSIPAQVRRLTEYAIKRNLSIHSTFQITESSSKETRKQFDKVISIVKKAKEPYALITDTVDRLQRSFRETPLLDTLRKQGKLELHFLREGLVINQTSNSSQLLQWDIGVLFASSYVRQLSDNVKRSQEQCIKNGQWFSKAPYGYKNVTLPSGIKHIEIDNNQAPFVIEMFELYARGNQSFQTIVTKMRKNNFAKTDRGKSITKRTVEIILKNPFYMGLMRIKGQLYPHKYKSLISKDLFNNVQNLIANRNKSPIQYAGKPILLRGLIYCKKCGGAISGYIKKQKYVYYSCHNSKGICTKKIVKEESLISILLPYFDKIRLTNEQINEITDYINNHIKQETQSVKKEQQQINQRLMLLKERISKLIDMHLDGRIDTKTYHFKIEEYRKQQNSLTMKLTSHDTDIKQELIVAKDVLNLAGQAKELFLSSKIDEKQQLLRFFFSNLRLDYDKLDVELREPFNMIAISKNRTIWRGQRDSNSRPSA